MKTYRLVKEMRGTVSVGSHRVIRTLPVSSLLRLVGPTENSGSELDVLWDGQAIRVFEQDFSARAVETIDGIPHSEAASIEESRVAKAPVPVPPSFRVAPPRP